MAGAPSDSSGLDDTLPSPGSPAASSPAQAPERVGRYRLERVLGRGGMGVVHAAHDPDLDRLVALKVMHDSRGQARLVREAQAMARLRHPNVLTVHDVGVAGDRVYITMELIAGTTLRAWQTAAPRSWREIVTMYLAAGRGLAAAHQADIVHRDFNPGNVLVGKDGSIYVADFGLARTGEAGSDDDARPSSGTASGNNPLTTVGTVVGTPAYMAPEQHEGATVGPAADQFAFAAALWEALAGAPPFVGANIDELAVAKREERVGPAPRRAPGWMVAMLRRAMRRDPGDRHASMADLVRALEHGLGRRRRVLAVAAAAATAAALAVLAIVLVTVRSTSGPGCKVAGADVAATWNDTARARITAAFTASDRPHAATTLPRVLAGLDRTAGALSSARIAACEAGRKGGTQAADVLARRDACLDRRRNDLRAIVTLLGSGPDPDVIDNAYETVIGLEDPAGCAAFAQSEVLQPAPAIRADVDDARARLAETDALLKTGKMAAAAAAIDAHVARARTLGFAPLLGETLLLRARILAEQGDAAGVEAFGDAATAGAEAHDDHLIAVALVEQLALLEDEGGKPADALQWMVAAEAAVARANDPELRDDFLVARGSTYRSLGRYAEARADLEAALASVEARTSEESFDTGLVVAILANVLSDEGKMDEALALDRRVEAIYQETIGPEHPKFAQLLNNIGLRLDAAGKYDEARIEHERALALKERVMGPEHPSVAMSLNNLAVVASHRGRAAESLAYNRRALAIREKTLGPEHPLTASTLTNIGIDLALGGSNEEALAVYRRALAIREKVLGPEHPSTASTLASMSRVLINLGRHDEALAAAKRALAIRKNVLGDHKLTAKSYLYLGEVLASMKKQNESCDAIAEGLVVMGRVVDPEHPELMSYLIGASDCLLMQGKARAAVPLAERAVAIGENHDGDATHLARARGELAIALWEAGGNDARALQLARDAYAHLAGVPGNEEDTVGLVRLLKANGVAVQAP
ncbi:MAG TPA: serine/threonine-protein kinase [Kofleriaceae bacterium]|nr:serine/threonine-protein kinase [Kofleriaceae bacterium]